MTTRTLLPSMLLVTVALGLGAAGAWPHAAVAQTAALTVTQTPEEAAFAETMQLAESGEPYAALKLGRLYRDGKGVPQDADEALAWFKKAADGGVPEALDDLGDLAFKGVGAEAGPAVADPEAALAYYLRGAQAGLTGRLERIGDLYARPDLPMRDRTRADDYWRRAAAAYDTAVKAGEVWPCIRLARMYAEGRGVALNAARAIELYELAVSRGQVEAVIPIGDLYFAGEIVPKDPARAMAYYRRAEAGGAGGRLERMGNMYRDGMGVAADAATGDAYWRRAIDDYRTRAAAGDGWAALALGRMLRDGRGAAADPAAALGFFERAEALGVPGARREINDIRVSIASGPT